MAKLVEDLLKLRNEVLTNLADLEDFGDRFNHLGCVVVFIVCILMVMTKQYFLKPISCYIATESGGTNLLNYVENYCWVQGTITVKYTGKMPQTEADWQGLEGKKILYYQWVPFILAIQCGLFYLPRLLWTTCCLHSGTRGGALSRAVLRSVDALHSPPELRRGIIEEIADTVEHQMAWRNVRIARNGRCACKCRREVHIIIAYVTMKMLYLLNAVGQLFMMQQFLGFNSTVNPAFGLSLLQDIASGHDWQVTQVFPRVGYCYAPLKAFGVNSNAVTAQCVLPLNMLNEKIFIFLWWWVLFAALVTAFFLATWIFRFSTHKREVDYVMKYLQGLGDGDDVPGGNVESERVENFASYFLRREGMFLVRMVRLNAGEVIAALVVKALWQKYRKPTVGFRGMGEYRNVSPPIRPREAFPMFENAKTDVECSSQNGRSEKEMELPRNFTINFV